MRWTKHGAQTILNLRVVLLSGIWQRLYRRFLQAHDPGQLRTYGPSTQTSPHAKPPKRAHEEDYTLRHYMLYARTRSISRFAATAPGAPDTT